jgi:hypothetical protein
VNRDGAPGDIQYGPEPVVILVFDEDTGDFIDINSTADSSLDNANSLPIDETDTGSDSDAASDWVVYTSSDADSNKEIASNDMSAPTDTSLWIDWDAEAEDVNDLLPPPPPGRSGMKHGQEAAAAG